MSDDELEALRQRKMAELARQGESDEESAARDAAARQSYEAQKQSVLRTILDPDARERLARVKMARPDVAQSLEDQLVALHQQGRIRGTIDDKTLKQFLARVSPKSRDINIERR